MTRPEILDKAKECVCGQREQDYGIPESNFSRIAELWNAYFGDDLFSALDVSMMMALLKIARIRSNGGTDDSYVDLAGYAACGGEIFAVDKNTAEFTDEAARLDSLVTDENAPPELVAPGLWEA